MATYEELGRALKNADAAGDVEAARKLAEAIREQQYALAEQSSAPSKTTFVDIASAIN